MKDKQVQKSLEEIAAVYISDDLDLWPEIEERVERLNRSKIWQWGVRLVATAVAAFALILFATWFLSISQSPETDNAANGTIDTLREETTAVELVPPPQTTDNAANGTIDATREEPTYELDPQLVLPDTPASLPQYEVKILPPPQSPEAMLAWAENFGMPDPKLFRNPRIPEQPLVVGSDGSRLIFPGSESAPWDVEIRYIRSVWLGLFSGETITFNAGVAAAQSFLTQHNQLPSDYQVVEKISSLVNMSGYPVPMFQFTPDLNGYPILHGTEDKGVGASIFVESDGTISAAEFSEAIFTEADAVHVRPVEEVVAELTDSDTPPFPHITFSVNPDWSSIRHYFPPLPEHTIGQQVTILETDDTHYLVAEDGSEVRATLGTAEGGRYQLITPDLAQIVNIIGNYIEHRPTPAPTPANSAQIVNISGNDVLSVTGTIEAQLAPDTWQLVVQNWEFIPRQTSDCAIGPVTIEGNNTWVMGEHIHSGLSGQYYLENLPPDIQSGDQLEVCGKQIPVGGGTLPWTVIFSPPRDAIETAPFTSNEYIIETVQLVYVYDDSNSPESSLTFPIWMITGRSKDNATFFINVYDATQQ